MYDVATMSCVFVLSGHTEIVVCLDNCVASSGRTLLVTGSKDNTVSCMIFFQLSRSILMYIMCVIPNC